MISRRDFMRQTGLAAALLAGAPTELLAAKETRLTVLHTNDMHSRIDPFPNDGRQWGGMGGMARRAALIAQIRRESEHVLLLDAGDIFQGTPYFNYFGGEVEYKLMGQMGYDVATLGNHDFDNGLEGLERMLPHANFQIVNANYNFDKTILKNRFKPYTIVQKGPIKVGIFGLGILLQGLVPDKLSGQTVYTDPVSVAREMVQELKAKKCNLIICLSHMGYKYDSDKISDIKLAQAVDGIDLIIGGHTHTFLPEPVRFTSLGGHPVLVNQVGWAGINIGKIEFYFSKSSIIKAISSVQIPVNENLARL